MAGHQYNRDCHFFLSNVELLFDRGVEKTIYTTFSVLKDSAKDIFRTSEIIGNPNRSFYQIHICWKQIHISFKGSSILADLYLDAYLDMKGNSKVNCLIVCKIALQSCKILGRAANYKHPAFDTFKHNFVQMHFCCCPNFQLSCTLSKVKLS